MISAFFMRHETVLIYASQPSECAAPKCKTGFRAIAGVIVANQHRTAFDLQIRDGHLVCELSFRRTIVIRHGEAQPHRCL